MVKMTKKKDDRTEKTFKQGLAGGILGAVVGVPGVGAAIGIAHANKDKIKKFAKDADKK